MTALPAPTPEVPPMQLATPAKMTTDQFLVYLVEKAMTVVDAEFTPTVGATRKALIRAFHNALASGATIYDCETTLTNEEQDQSAARYGEMKAAAAVLREVVLNLQTRGSAAYTASILSLEIVAERLEQPR